MNRVNLENLKDDFFKLKLREDKEENLRLYSWMFMSCFVGSISHGTCDLSDKDSIDDIDVMMVVVPDIKYYYGLRQYGSRGTKVYKREKWDVVTYEIKKFFSLLLKQNPNVIGLLWLKPEHYIHKNLEAQFLIENRDIFSSKLVYNSFIGYARGQLKRMTSFQKYDGFMGKKRKQLVDEYGYDTKNASHLIRLLTMGIEFLETGFLNVYRKEDKQLYIDIKQGKYKLEEIKEMARDLFSAALNAHRQSPLPPRPDKEKVELILINLIRNTMSLYDFNNYLGSFKNIDDISISFDAIEKENGSGE